MIVFMAFSYYHITESTRLASENFLKCKAGYYENKERDINFGYFIYIDSDYRYLPH